MVRVTCGILCLGAVVPAQAAWQFPLHTALDAHGGAERLTLRLPDASLGKPTLMGYSYGAGVVVAPLVYDRFSLQLGLGMFGFSLGARLEQWQFSREETGRFDAAILGLEGRLGVRYRTPIAPLSVTGGVLYDSGLSGRIRAKIGIIDFDEKLQSLGRLGVTLGAEWVVLRSLAVRLEGAWLDGSLKSKSQTDESLFSTLATDATVDFSGFGGWLGVTWTVWGQAPARAVRQPRKAKPTPAADAP